MVSFPTRGQRRSRNWVTRNIRNSRRAAVMLERGIPQTKFVQNVTPSGLFIGDAQEPLDRMKTILAGSNRLYRQGNTIVFLRSQEPDDLCASTPIVVDGVITKTASVVVSNVLMCSKRKANSTGKGAEVDQPAEYELQFAVPKSVLQQVVTMDGFEQEISEARFIFNHPVFDADLNWLEVGYHASQRILVCGESLEPAELGPVVAQGEPQTLDDVLNRLPPLIRRWVAGFDWASPIDLINYLGAALMTPLMPLLVDDKHPGVMMWANKPSIGKTLAGQCLATLKDGKPAGVTSVQGGPREIENQIASEMNDGRTVIFLDNQKGAMNVPVLEGNMTANEVAIRGFHIQRKVRRPNDLLWLITTNNAVPSDDLLSRCIHVRLDFEGEADSRGFAMTDSELLNYVRENRVGILAELAGMVVRWLDAGRPSAPAPCRFRVFGNVVGSVLTANGLPGLLSNTREEVRQNSTTHQQLVTVAERLIDNRDQSFLLEVDGEITDGDSQFKQGPRPTNPKEQKDWVPYLISAGVITAACTTPNMQKAAAGAYLKSIVNVPTEVDVDDGTVLAMVVSRPLGKRRTAYALAVKGLPAAGAIDHGDGDETGDIAAVEGAGGDTSLTVPNKLTADNQAGEATSGPADDLGAGNGAIAGDEADEDDLWGPD